MKKFILLLISTALLLSLAACGGSPSGLSPDTPGTGDGGDADNPSAPDDGGDAQDGAAPGQSDGDGIPGNTVIPGGVAIFLSDSGVTVDGEAAPEDPSAPVYVAHDIVYYEAGHDFTYGEGTAADEHTAGDAAAHTVVHIAAPGTYVISGKLSAGQIAVDLGKDAEDDPEAVVDLVLSGVDLTCTVAPAIIFYNVYECGDSDNAQSSVDTSAAGANITLAGGTENTVSGSYVARIYKSFELSEDGSRVVSNKKLHKYDGAVYSKMSMNVNGDGVLNINAENEGLDSELHLTINGGVINIVSGNDGINTNEDGVSVTTVNGGQLTITVDGSTGEGDGIDSNGWLVINGGVVRAYACSTSADAGIDSDMGIIINGGQVVATGNMLDAIDEASAQKYVLFNMSPTNSRDLSGAVLTLRDADGSELMSFPTVNSFTFLIVSSPDLTDDSVELYDGSALIASAVPGQSTGGPGGIGGPGGMGGPGGQTPPDGGFPDGQTPPDGGFPNGQTPPDGGFPEGQTPPDGGFPDGQTPPDGERPPEPPEGELTEPGN